MVPQTRFLFSYNTYKYTLMYILQENIDVTINERPEKLYM